MSGRGLTQVEQFVLDEYRKHKGDLRASEVATTLKIDHVVAYNAVTALAELGYLVAATIRRPGAPSDVQARLSLVEPTSETARAAPLAAPEVPVRRVVEQPVPTEPAAAAEPRPVEPTAPVVARVKWRPTRMTDAPRRAPLELAPASNVPSADRIGVHSDEPGKARFGLFSDGSMHLSRDGVSLDLNPEETRALFSFLDRFSGLAAEVL